MQYESQINEMLNNKKEDHGCITSLLNVGDAQINEKKMIISANNQRVPTQ